MELEELNFEKILQKANKSGNAGVVIKGFTSTWHQVCRETKSHVKLAVIFNNIELSNRLPILESTPGFELGFDH